MFKRLSCVLISAGLSLCALSVSAQNAPADAKPPGAQTAAPRLPGQPFDHMFELPSGLLQALSLEKKQKELLDKAHMARRQLWSALRNARMQEYAALTKELDKETFDPKEVISLRKKIRLEADKRMDEVQSIWLDFWESLNPAQRKTLVSYMKQQHITNAKLSQQRAALEKAANPVAAQPR